MKKIAILFVLMIFTISGCAKKTQDTKTTETKIETSNDSFSTDGGEFAYQFNYHTDCQAEQGQYQTQIYTSDGYYDLQTVSQKDMSNILMFYDYEKNVKIPVCNKSNCEHNSNSCDAYFDNIQYPIATIMYFEDNIYMPCIDGDYLGIMKISKDGKEREKVFDIDRINKIEDENEDTSTTTIYYPKMIIHRGYLYYTNSYPGVTKAELFVRSLDDGASEKVIDTIEGENVSLYRIKGYGDNIFYQKAEYAEDGSVKGGLYVCDTESLESRLVREDIISYYTIDKYGSIYYESAEDGYIYKYSKSDEAENTELFYAKGELECEGICCYDERFIIYTLTDNGEQQYVLDLQGNVLSQTDDYENFEKIYESI